MPTNTNQINKSFATMSGEGGVQRDGLPSFHPAFPLSLRTGFSTAHVCAEGQPSLTPTPALAVPAKVTTGLLLYFFTCLLTHSFTPLALRPCNSRSPFLPPAIQLGAQDVLVHLLLGLGCAPDVLARRSWLRAISLEELGLPCGDPPRRYVTI